MMSALVFLGGQTRLPRRAWPLPQPVYRARSKWYTASPLGKSLERVVGLEPTTFRLSGEKRCSTELSYTLSLNFRRGMPEPKFRSQSPTSRGRAVGRLFHSP